MNDHNVITKTGWLTDSEPANRFYTEEDFICIPSFLFKYTMMCT